ncbi:MAG TPA: 2-oxoacid:acceptor oxidoreductase subunit alpha [Isosphaeraceae bacterium]|nr:2-oxoacid:acceptor oxidoreductase subunit alpha [Isosphaeraceae bacterium]
MASTLTVVETLPVEDGPAQTPPSVNDLAIRVGTVNGSGSQSANLVLLRALHGMGIPCSGKNVFPSNIEGLPTWFHIRANANGYVGHRLDTPVLVCMNEQTAADDIRLLRPGSVVIYRDDIDLGITRDDVQLFPVPFQRLVEEAYPPDKADKGYRDKLRKVINMVYVGVVAGACGIEMDEVRRAIRREFPGRKAKAAEINIRAAETGFAWALENLPEGLPFRVERADRTAGTILIEGNKASALGAVFGGASVMTWYPITPSSSLAEYAEDYFKKLRTKADGRRTFAVIQAEDELAAVGMAIGAGWAGARAITATSGPGISLMSEFVGLAYFAEIPVVICDVQRMGPSTGLPTRTSQGDVLKLHLLGHGDCRHIVLLPGSVAECFALTAEAVDLAQEFQTPVFVASDLDLGMNLWMSEPFAYPEKPVRRGKVLDANELERLGHFERYRDLDGDGVCYRTLPGTEHPLASYFTRGTGHNEKSGYSERPEDWKRNLDRLARKLETARQRIPAPVVHDEPGAKVGLIAFGSSHFALVEARDVLCARGVPNSYLRLRALPFSAEVEQFVARHERVYVVEQNRDGQIYTLLRASLNGTLDDRLVSVTHYNGTPLAAENIYRPILDWERNFSAHGSLSNGHTEDELEPEDDLSSTTE